MIGEILREILVWMLGMAGIVGTLGILWIAVFGKEKKYGQNK